MSEPWQIVVGDRVLADCARLSRKVRQLGEGIEELEFRSNRPKKQLRRWLAGYDTPERLVREWPLMGAFVTGFEGLKPTGVIHDSVLYEMVALKALGPRREIPRWWRKWMPVVAVEARRRKRVGFEDFSEIVRRAYSRAAIEKLVDKTNRFLDYYKG